jgi:hypothetical protein
MTWKSKKAQTTATSTTIAELDGIYHCATECKWIGEFLVSLGVKSKEGFKIFCDNQLAVKVQAGKKYLDQTVEMQDAQGYVARCTTLSTSSFCLVVWSARRYQHYSLGGHGHRHGFKPCS